MHKFFSRCQQGRHSNSTTCRLLRLVKHLCGQFCALHTSFSFLLILFCHPPPFFSPKVLKVLNNVIETGNNSRQDLDPEPNLDAHHLKFFNSGSIGIFGIDRNIRDRQEYSGSIGRKKTIYTIPVYILTVMRIRINGNFASSEPDLGTGS